MKKKMKYLDAIEFCVLLLDTCERGEIAEAIRESGREVVSVHAMRPDCVDVRLDDGTVYQLTIRKMFQAD